MKVFHAPALLGSLLLATSAAAQTTFRLGPSVVGLQSTASLETDPTYSRASRLGFEAGLLASWQRGHVALRYAQRGFSWRSDHPDGISEQFRLAYLLLPVQLAYVQHPDGHGFQVFAGPYLGWLLGGHHVVSGGLAGRQLEGDVVGANERTVETNTLQPDASFYARRLDLGAQGGVGYQRGRALLQASYSVGLRNVAAPVTYLSNGVPTSSYSPRYYNRAVQVSVSYLFGARE